MIIYSSMGLANLCRMRGSVFPAALLRALPCALLTAAIKFSINRFQWEILSKEDSILKQSQPWAGFSFLVGFLIVFRTSQAYKRFVSGTTATHRMRSEWFDTCASLVSFLKYSQVDGEVLMRFRHKLVRLFSMLHNAALADLEDLKVQKRAGEVKAFRFDLIDAGSLDKHSLELLRTTEARVELLFQWIQISIVENIDNGVLAVPAPLLSRPFQELANGMISFHDAVKISSIPFPFPYAQVCESLLVLHWLVMPFVFSQWVTSPFWGFVLVFIQVFVLWALNFIATEIEQPFGDDANDLDGRHMQREMNRFLLMLLSPQSSQSPVLEEVDLDTLDRRAHLQTGTARGQGGSFYDVWAGVKEVRKSHFVFGNALRSSEECKLQRSSVGSGASSQSEGVHGSFSWDSKGFFVDPHKGSVPSTEAREGSQPARRKGACDEEATTLPALKGSWEQIPGGAQEPGQNSQRTGPHVNFDLESPGERRREGSREQHEPRAKRHTAHANGHKLANPGSVGLSMAQAQVAGTPMLVAADDPAEPAQLASKAMLAAVVEPAVPAQREGRPVLAAASKAVAPAQLAVTPALVVAPSPVALEGETETSDVFFVL